MSGDVPPERPGKVDSLHGASDEDWAEAVRRAAIIRPLSEARRCSKAVVQAAAKSLGLSIPRTYRLVQKFRSRPLTASLLPLTRGRVKGSRRLDPKVEAHIDEAVDAIYLKPERPTVKRLFGEVHRNCVAAGIKPPSMKALRTRVSARSLRERTKAREGAAIAADRFRQVKSGLRTERPLQVVQIDHTKVDIMLVDDVTRACIGRPWLTLVLDVHTRMVAGLTLSLDPPSAAGTALALTQAVLPKAAWLADRAINLAWSAFGLPA
jgi:putative transposase